MKFTPLNGHIQVKPIEEGGIVKGSSSKYEEKGSVIGWDIDLTPKISFKIGSVVMFDGWLAAKYNIDTEDEVWFVKYEDIRAIEHE